MSRAERDIFVPIPTPRPCHDTLSVSFVRTSISNQCTNGSSSNEAPPRSSLLDRSYLRLFKRRDGIVILFSRPLCRKSYARTLHSSPAFYSSYRIGATVPVVVGSPRSSSVIVGTRRSSSAVVGRPTVGYLPVNADKSRFFTILRKLDNFRSPW